MVSVGGLGAMDDVEFDFGVSADVRACFTNAASSLRMVLGTLPGIRSAALVDFAGHYSTIFANNGLTQTSNAETIASALDEVTTLVAEMEILAQEENARRATARAWVEAQKHENGLKRMWDDITGGDQPPPVTYSDPPARAAQAPTPTPPQPMEGIGSSGGTSSADPVNLRGFAASTLTVNDQLGSVSSILTGALDSFRNACSWATLSADGCVTAVTSWLSQNSNEVAWANAVAQAFEAAGSNGGQTALANASIEAALKSAHVGESRATVSVEPPSAYGSPPTTGYADDPVNTATGNFLETEVDLAFVGAASLLTLERTYNSLNATAGAFGPGWSSWTECGVALADDAARFTLPDGREIRFGRLDDGWDRADSDDLWLARTPEGLEVTGRIGQTWRFSPSGRPVEMRQGATAGLAFAHDGAGRLVRVQHSLGRWFELQWAEVAGSSRVVAAVTSDRRRVEFRYDDAGRLLAAAAGGAVRSYRWNEQGLVQAVVDPDGVVEVDNTYDEAGRVTSQRSPHGRTTFYSYLPGNVTAVSDADGTRSNTWIHDVRGRLVGVVDAEGQRQSMAYDARNHLVMVTERNGALTLAQFDERGRQTVRVLPSGARLEWTHDEADRAVQAVVLNDGVRAVTTMDYEGDATDPVTVTDAAGGVTRMVWDGGLLKQVTDPTGVTLTLTHDEFGDLVATTDAAGNTARLERDAQGRVVAAITPLGHRTSYVYDEVSGVLVSQTDPLGATWRYEYTAGGRRTAIIDPLGHRTEVSYDDAGDLSATTDPLGRTISEERDDLGNLTSVELPDGSRWGFGHDGLSRLTEFTDGTGGRWQAEYDANGSLRRTLDATGVERTVESNLSGLPVSAGDVDSRSRAAYDQLGRIVTTTGDDGSSTSTRRDLCGRVVSFTDEAGATTTMERDAAGRVIAVTHPMGGTFRYEYDACGRHAATIDTDGSRYELTCDADGRVCGELWPTGERAWSRFDAAGRVVERHESGRGTTRYEYDALGRMVSSRDPFNGLRRFRYDAAGQMVEAVNAAGGATHYEYDVMGRVAAVVDPLGGRTERTYDSLNRVLTQTDALGRTTFFGYDAAGRLTKRTDATGACLEWTHDAAGRVRDELADGRLLTRTERDFAGRTITVSGPGGVNELSWDERGNLVRRLRDGVGLGWSYDADGRRTAFTRPDGSQTQYEYDAAGRVCALSHTGLGRSTIDRDAVGRIVSVNGPGMHATWTWADGAVVEHRMVQDGVETLTRVERDVDGRVLAEVVNGSRTDYHYDAAGQLVRLCSAAGVTDLTHDANGRLVLESGPTGVTRYSYDEAGQLTSMRGPRGVTDFGYDAGGRRVREQGPEGERRFAWDPRGFLARVTSVAHVQDRVRSASDELVVDALGELAAVNGTSLLWDSASAVPSLAQVGSRSVVQFAGATGMAGDDRPEWMAPSWRERGAGSDPWAAPTSVATGGGLRVGALGSVQVAGLEWMQARVYDPATRGFLSTDPLDGVPGAAWAGNPYSFAGNDPVGMSDPLGLRPVTDAELQGYRDAHQGALARAGHAVAGWWNDNWEYVAGGALLVAGVAVAATGIGGPIGAGMIAGGLMMAGGSVVSQKVQDGTVDWGRVVVDGAIGAVAGGAAGAVFSGASALLQGASCLGRNVIAGAASGAADGAITGGLSYLTGDGPKSVGDFLLHTGGGLAGGALLGGAMGGLITKVTGQACFVADTQVLMGDGSSKAIQDVVVGDEVLAWNHATGENEARRVVETFVHDDVETWEVETADGVVTTTAEHPFYVEGTGWTPAKDLRPGDVLSTADGAAVVVVVVVRVEPTGDKARVFNFHVEDLHNYHVGAGMRVHNRCGEVSEIDPHNIRFSQNSVSGARRLVSRMKSMGWNGGPIDVVRMSDGMLTTVDNTRVAAARTADIDVKAIVRDFDELLPNRSMATRFMSRRVKLPPLTWGDAVEWRISSQASGFRHRFPLGSFEMPQWR